jgi:hypothetical protein
MKALPCKTSGGTTFRFEFTEDEFHEFDEGGVGFCIACGQQADDHVEPDARGYKCSACHQLKVMGTAELLIMGRVDLADGDGGDA